MNDTAPYDAHCHCGAVRIRIAAKPEYMNDCNCSLCRKTGAIWGYYDPAEVSIVFQAKAGTGIAARKCDQEDSSGKAKSYTRADKADPAVRIHFCGTCGVTTHWTLTEGFAAENPEEAGRMGVNMRLFGDEAKAGVEVRFPDGASWEG